MNERIQKLTEQAGIELPNNVVDGINGPGVVSEKDKLAKFAELIVRECIEQVITGPNGPAHYAVEAALRLKKHFGVK